MTAENDSPAAPTGAGQEGQQPPLYVVGIGASTGGVAALKALLGGLPANPGFACVVVVHLSPEHESFLPDVLQPHCAMPIQQVTATVALERNRVYVIPPNANLNTIDTHLRLSALEQRRIERAPIDHFLRTLAGTHDGSSIGVILTGAGSDGSRGLRQIKEHGGVTIAQDPDEAEADGMPLNAIATGMVDLVLPLQRIAQTLQRLCSSHPKLPSADDNDVLDASDAERLNAILGAVRKRTGQDFSGYRRSAVLRRVRRRMRLKEQESFRSYMKLVESQPAEAEALVSDLTLTPTEFFCDTDTFRAFEREVLPQLFDAKSYEGARVRVWTIGCSTGEEAYSAAMLLEEERTRRGSAVHLQVFASDVSNKLLGMAREGIYPREIAATVSAERLNRFFKPEGGYFRVKRPLRDLVLFTEQNLFRDPPFAHIDVIICRNLLANLQPEMRQGVMSLLHYSLGSAGMLLLGPGDDASDAPSLFEPVPGAHRVFRKLPSNVIAPALPGSMRPFGPGGIRTAEEWERSPTTDAASVYRSSIERYTPPSVLINASNHVVYFSPTSGRYLRIPGGDLTHDLTRLVDEPIHSQLLDALPLVNGELRFWSSPELTVGTSHGPFRIVLHVERVAGSDLILVVFDESPSVRAAQASETHPGEAQTDPRLSRGPVQSPAAESQLRQASIELASVLEELDASNEELQAANQELQALDAENHRRLQELQQISADLQHLMASTGMATLFLDRELRIVRFTPLLGELLGLRLSDVGRSISDLARLSRYGELQSDARIARNELKRVDREIPGFDGGWYLSRVLPYKNQSDAVAGVVLTFIDITERKRAEEALRRADRQKDEFLATLAHELRNPLAPISSGIEVLKAAPGNTELVERMAATMGRQTKQLVRLVDDLLEVSRISGGKLRLHSTVLDLREVIQDAIVSVKPSIEGAQHDLRVDLPAEKITVKGDATRLTQVVANLLTNATRYTGSPGIIWLRARVEADEAVVSVRDNGVGISKSAREHVFDMFFQGHNVRPGFSAGLGIGLTLAKTLVEMHGGRINVASDGENQGSEFTVHLPVTKGRPSDVSGNGAASRVPRQRGGHRILIVDDNVDAADTLSTLMKSLGEHQVHTAANGKEALQAAHALQPDIVVLDLLMPDMDGYEVARKLRNEPWGKDVFLIALSGWGHEEHRRRSREAGFDRHLTKPADVAQLQDMINEHQPPG